jgi:ribonuclease HI
MKSMAKKKKYYVVWDGVNPGVYHSWTECQMQIKGYPNAKYKSYASLDEANDAYAAGYEQPVSKSRKTKSENNNIVDLPIEKNSISVDAACSGNPGMMEYRGVFTTDKTEIFRQGPFIDGTNNIGEFLALVHALAFLHKKGKGNTTIYTDSRTAMAWVRNKKVKTTLKKNARNKVLFELIERAEKWIKSHTYKNPILKWPTEKWGEIPADFGRK